MTLRGALKLIQDIAQVKRVSTPFICGGTPRDKVMGRISEMVDVDITTGDKTIHRLGRELADALPDAIYKKHDDGHAQINMDGIKLDFSSNFLVPDIKAILNRVGIANPTDMQCELYSRDFTCNALLMSLDLKTIKDPTGLGIPDIKKKLLRTCLPASLTLGSQPKRVIRIIYLATKLGFEVDQEIIDWVKMNPSSLASAKPRTIAEKIRSSLEYDKPKTIHLLDSMGLWKYLPATSETSNLMIDQKKI